MPALFKIASLQFLHNISKKKLEMKLIFSMQINNLIIATFIKADTPAQMFSYEFC